MIVRIDQQNFVISYTQEIIPDNEAHEKDFVDRKNFIKIAPKLYNKFLNKYQTQYNKLPEDKKKKRNVTNKPGI